MSEFCLLDAPMPALVGTSMLLAFGGAPAIGLGAATREKWPASAATSPAWTSAGAPTSAHRSVVELPARPGPMATWVLGTLAFVAVAARVYRLTVTRDLADVPTTRTGRR